MKLSLARWDFDGSSQGWWLIREIPGAYVFSVGGGWSFNNNPQMLNGFGALAEKLWGFDWTPGQLPERRVFKTRAEVISYLEMNLSTLGSPQLAEML